MPSCPVSFCLNQRTKVWVTVIVTVKQICTVVYSQEINKDIPTTPKTQSLNTTDPVQSTSSFNVTGSGDIRMARTDTQREVQRMLSDYEELSKTLLQYMSTPTQQNTLQHNIQSNLNFQSSSIFTGCSLLAAFLTFHTGNLRYTGVKLGITHQISLIIMFVGR